MNTTKTTKNRLLKWILGEKNIPKELTELHEYFRSLGPISFTIETSNDGFLLAKSTNFRYGSMVTSGENMKELDENIKDAILTAFDIPSMYLVETGLQQEGEIGTEQLTYALS